MTGRDPLVDWDGLGPDSPHGAVAEAVEPDDGLAVLVRDGRVVRATDGFDASLSLDPAVAAGERDFYDALAAVGDDAGATAVRAAAAEEEAVETTLTVGTGEDARVFRHVGVPLPSDAPGDRVECFEDGTGERARADCLAAFERLAEHARDGLFATDDDGRLVYCNESFASRLRADRCDLRGAPASALVVAADQAAWTAAVDACGPGDEETLTVDFRRVGRSVRLTVHLTGRPEGGVLAAVRRPDGCEAERARRVEQYRTLVESAPDPMWVLDGDDRIELCNEAMASFLGGSAEALEGQAVADVVPAEAASRVAEALSVVRGRDRRRWNDTELTLPNAGGEPRDFEATFGPVRRDGAVVGTVGTFRDVTERERRATELRHLQAVLGGVVRHDVGRSAHEIRDLAERLVARLDGERTALAEAIAERADALAALAAKTAAVERLVEADPEPSATDLAALVDRGIEAVGDGAGEGTVELDAGTDADTDADTHADVEVDVPSVGVRAVPALDLAVENLVENALVHAGELPTVTVTATVDDRDVTLTVADDGPGIESSELAALERGAETTLEHGSGVGLWLVDWAVSKSGGDLAFETDGGTRASIRLDRADAARPEAPVESRESDVHLLHVDADRMATARIRDAATAVDHAVAVERTADVATAVDALSTGRVDCLVTERPDDGDWSRLDDAAAAAGVPVVCYTAAAHTAFDEDRLTAVDSLVEKGTGSEPATLLLEKVLAVAGVDGTERTDRDDDRRSRAATVADGETDTDAEAGETAAGTVRAVDDDPSGVDAGATERADAGTAVRLADENDCWERVPDGHPGFEGLPEAITDGVGGADGADGVDGAGGADGVDGADGAGGADGVDGAGSAVAPVRVGDDGERRWFGYWERDLGGGLRVACSRDLTSVVERERRLALLSALVDHARDAVSVVDANGEVVYHNAAFADLLGDEDMTGTHAATYMAAGELEKGQLAVQRLLATPELDSEVLDLTFETVDGETVTLAVHFAVRRANGEYGGVVNVAREDTGATADERGVERYRTLVESAGDPMFVLDADGAVVLVNEALERLLGRPRAALRGVAVGDLFPDERGDEGGAAVERWLTEDGDGTFEAWVRGADGERHRYEVTAAEPATFDGTVCTCREVTERERRTEELALLEQVLGRVLRHNLRNELTLVAGHAQLIADAADEEVATLARSVRRLCDDLAATAANARAVEQAVERRRESRSQSLAHVVDAAVETVEHRHERVTVTSDVPGDLTVTVPEPFATAVEALVAALGRRSDADDPRVRVDASVTGGRVELRASIPADHASGAALDPFAADPDTVLERHRDAGIWLFAWVLDGSDARVHRDWTGDRRAVVVDLPVADTDADADADADTDADTDADADADADTDADTDADADADADNDADTDADAGSPDEQ
ncbi:PAS domain S-box protein [Halosimplex salinum]|uniref:PAS domain S-box protein n=1 Tax=Halosimplex salinum TaxID=1710538 RepID=UPI000F4A76EB|nr:PAS domain S-box protein [Halosimplex salinum]